MPARIQSALLTVTADNYAETLDQVYECLESAGFLKANGDQSGGCVAYQRRYAIVST